MIQILGNFLGNLEITIHLITSRNSLSGLYCTPPTFPFLPFCELCVPHSGPPTSGEQEGDWTQGPQGGLPKAWLCISPSRLSPRFHGLCPWLTHCHPISGSYLRAWRSKKPQGPSLLVLGSAARQPQLWKEQWVTEPWVQSHLLPTSFMRQWWNGNSVGSALGEPSCLSYPLIKWPQSQGAHLVVAILKVCCEDHRK